MNCSALAGRTIATLHQCRKHATVWAETGWCKAIPYCTVHYQKDYIERFCNENWVDDVIAKLLRACNERKQRAEQRAKILEYRNRKKRALVKREHED